MSRIIHRPNQAVDYGTVNTTGSGNVLGDENYNTYKDYYEDSGSILLYPTFDPSVVPDGREIIAVRAGHHQKNGGLVGLHNGWVMGYLRINNTRVGKSVAYKQDGYSLAGRWVEGAAIYNTALAPWAAADINAMTTDVGAATGTFGPKKDKLWCICMESQIVLVIDDDVAVPTINYPANNAVIATSSVDFKGNVTVTQEEQPIAAVFQVSRVNTFDDDTVDTYVGGLVQAAGQTSNYDSIVGKDSYTNLGPGKWYVRTKAKDYRGVESDWGVTTSFTITHAALPVPTLSNPGPGTTKNTPYGDRAAVIGTVPSGERYVGVEFQFCQDVDFDTGEIVSWKNNAVGRYDIGVISYTSDPDPTVTPGLNGSKVSTDDPDQYLEQGNWYGRVRCVDVWNQTGAWSTPHAFTVSHPPTVEAPWPSGGKAFDDDAFPVRWTFGDAWKGDAQSAYQVIVRDPASNILYNTGKVVSPFNNANVEIDDAWKEQTLGLSIQLWDKDDVPSTVWTGSFKHSTAPYITLPYPAADERVITGEPDLDWSAVFAPGATQKSYQIMFIDRATGNVKYKTAIVATADSFWNAPTVVLDNVTDYQLALTITDTNDLYTTLLRNFYTDYIRPPQIACVASAANYEENGYVQILWSNSNLDPLFIEYRLYRKNMDIAGSNWEQIGTVTDPNQTTFQDWSTSGPYNYMYGITQVVMLYGAKVESLPYDNGDVLQVQSSHYWLIVPDNNDLNTKLYNVVGDKFTESIETNSHVIMEGGGTRVNYGAYIGMEGSLSAQIRTGSPITTGAARQRLRRIQFERGWCFLRDPFGNYTKVSIGSLGFDRVAGVGTEEMVDVEIPYVEVR